MQRINKFTNKLENLTRSPSPKRKIQINHVSRSNVKVRSHDDPNAKIINLQPLNEPENQKMKANAFEVVVENSSQNTHPMDEPLILGNGKKLYPENAVCNNTTISKNHDSNNTEELIILLYNLTTFCFSILKSFWKMDLYFKISMSENSNLNVHIPTTLLTLGCIKVLFSLSGTSSSPTYVVNSSSSNRIGLIPILIVLGLGLYWFSRSKTIPIKSEKSSTIFDSSSNIMSNDDIHTLESDRTSISENSLWSMKDSSNMNYESDITPPLSRKNSFQSKLETKLYNQKPQVQKLKVIHRQEEKQKNKKLDVNLPIDFKSKSQLTFDEISKQRRYELLNAFH